MNNKKGFTLVELLAVITLIAIVSLIAVPAVGGISKSIKSTMCKSKIKDAAVAAVEYASDGNLTSNVVTIETLISSGYLASDEKNSPVYDNPVKDSNATDKTLLKTNIELQENPKNDSWKVTNMEDLYKLCDAND